MTSNRDWPIVVLFHGSRKAEANTKARVLVKKLAVRYPNRLVEVAFLGLTTPLLPTVLKELAAKNPRRITIMPAFFFKGTHVSEDITKAITEAKRDYPVQKVVVAEPIGVCPELLDIFEQRIEESERR